jgi:predicted dehydrogenase
MGGPQPVQVTGSLYDLLSQPRFQKKGVPADIDDLASAFVKFDNGATLFVEISWDSHMAPGSYLYIFGTKGGLSWVNGQVTLHRDKGGKSVDELQDASKTKVENAYHHFVDCVLDPKKKMIAAGEECIAVQKVLDAIDRSARSGKAITIS